VSVDVGRRQAVDVVGDEVREAVAVVAEFAKWHDLLVQVGGVAIPSLRMGDARAATHTTRSTVVGCESQTSQTGWGMGSEGSEQVQGASY